MGFLYARCIYVLIAYDDTEYTYMDQVPLSTTTITIQIFGNGKKERLNHSLIYLSLKKLLSSFFFNFIEIVPNSNNKFQFVHH